MRIIVLLLIAAFSWPSIVNAQLEVAPDQYDLALERQPLSGALQELARQSGVQVIFLSSTTDGLEAPELKGRYTVIEALQLLLQSSKLTFREIKPATFEVRARDAVAPIAQALPAGVSLGESVASSDVPTSHGSIGGRVTAQAGTTYLFGAIVRILGTDQVTRTDETGTFRIPDLSAGDYTLEIAYLGLETRQFQLKLDGGQALSGLYALDEASAGLEQVVVFGNRSARAQSLNSQRSADNSSSVTSADLLGNFNDASISEALRRLPGISFERGPLGDGTNVSIRGLGPDMNNVQLNGLNLPNAGLGRAPVLNTLLAENVERIIVNETLLPSHDSSGTGGLIQIETKSPLNRARRYANFSFERGHRGEGFGDELTLSGMISGRFGAEQNFGLSASMQYFDRSGRTIEYSSQLEFAQYLPLDAFGRPSLYGPGLIDPRTSFPFEPGAAEAYPASMSLGLVGLELNNRAYSVSAEWQVSDGLRMQLDLQRSTQTEDELSRSLDMSFDMRYRLRPIQGLGGEMRQALEWDGTGYASQSFVLQDGRKTTTDTASFRGQGEHGRWAHSWLLGTARGSLDAPVVFQGTFEQPFDQAMDPAFISRQAVDAVEGRILSVFGPRRGTTIPVPLLTDAGRAFFADPDAYGFSAGFVGYAKNETERHTGQLTTRLDFQERPLQYLEAGAHFESSRFQSRFDQSLYDGSQFIDEEPYVVYPSAAELGVGFDDPQLQPVGIPTGTFTTLSKSEVRGFYERLGALSGGNAPLLTVYSGFRDPRLNQQSLQEDNLSTYLQARVDFGKLSLVGGARLSHVDLESVSLVSPMVIDENGIPDMAFAERFTRLESFDSTASDILPRIQLNYRQSDNLIFRGAYYLTVARPSTTDLSQESRISLNLSPFAGGGPNFDQPLLTIFEGNPELLPAVGDNYDLSAEYYTESLGLIKLSLFYKRISNVLQLTTRQGFDVLDGVELPDDPYFQNLPDDLVVSGLRPENSPDVAEHRGISLAVERQLTFLPGLWSGLGVYGNYTFSRDAVPQVYTWFNSPVFDTDGDLVGTEAVDLDVGRTDKRVKSGTIALTYTHNAIDGSLAYSYQNGVQGTFRDFGLLPLNPRVTSLDVRLQYELKKWNGRYRVYFEGSNILRGPSSLEDFDGFAASGERYVSDGRYYGGRTLRAGVSATF